MGCLEVCDFLMIWENGVCGIWVRIEIVEYGFGEFYFSINGFDFKEPLFSFFVPVCAGFFNLCGPELWGSGSVIWFPVKEDQRLELEHDKEMGWLLIKLKSHIA